MPTGAADAVLVCDHASNRVPERLGTLGLEPVLLADHIGWDPGAADVARRLASPSGFPVGVERLLASCHRLQSTARPCGIHCRAKRRRVHPGQPSGCRRRKRDPHRCAVPALPRCHLPAARWPSHRPTSVAQHPQLYAGPERPVATLAHRRLLIGATRGSPRCCSERSRRTGDFTIGDNEPYPIEDDIDYTIPVHGEGRGLPSVMIEIRQDQLLTSGGARPAWGRDGSRQPVATSRRSLPRPFRGSRFTGVILHRGRRV